MPETFAQWLWFAFYTGGAVGGWTVVCIAAGYVWQAVRVQLWLDRLNK